MKGGAAKPRTRAGPQERAPESGAAIPAFFLYGEPLQPPDERMIHIETIAARSTLHDWVIQPHRHRNLYQLLILQRGRVAVRLDEAAATLRGPALVVTPPGSVHAFRFTPGTDGAVVSFDAGLPADLARREARLSEFLDRPLARALDRTSVAATDLGSLCRMLLREFGRSAPLRHTAVRGLLTALLANAARVIESDRAQVRDTVPPDRELVARFRRLIAHQYREHARIHAYAEQLGVSEARLRRACLAVAGQPPVELVQLRLLVEAERQLRYTTMSIAQIAYHLGFEDPAYFSRFFAKRMHLSPRAFRSAKA